jgi:hypothetical protein
MMRCVKRGGAATAPKCLVALIFSFEAPLALEVAPTAMIIIKKLEAEKRGNTEAVTRVIAIVIASPAMPMPSQTPAVAFPAVPAMDLLNQALIECGQAICR